MPVIDCHSHWYPRAYFEARVGREGYPRCERDRSGYRLEMMPGVQFPVREPLVELELIFERADAAGIEVLVSNSAPLCSVDALPPDVAKEVAFRLNEEKAQAALPMQDARAAIEVLDDAILRLQLRGVCIGSNINGARISSEHCLPVFKRIEQLGVPLFLHPVPTTLSDRLQDIGLKYLVGFAFDTTLAVLRLVFSGMLDACPRLVVVDPYLGGTIPYLAGRIDMEYKLPWAGNAELPRLPSAYLRQFYTDTASNNPAALGFAKEFYGIERILFGSDDPWLSAEVGVDLVRGRLEADECEAVLAGNARRLLARGSELRPGEKVMRDMS